MEVPVVTTQPTSSGPSGTTILLLAKIGSMFVLGLGSLILGMLPLIIGRCRVKKSENRRAITSVSSASTTLSSASTLTVHSHDSTQASRRATGEGKKGVQTKNKTSPGSADVAAPLLRRRSPAVHDVPAPGAGGPGERRAPPVERPAGQPRQPQPRGAALLLRLLLRLPGRGGGPRGPDRQARVLGDAALPHGLGAPLQQQQRPPEQQQQQQHQQQRHQQRPAQLPVGPAARLARRELRRRGGVRERGPAAAEAAGADVRALAERGRGARGRGQAAGQGQPRRGRRPRAHPRRLDAQPPHRPGPLLPRDLRGPGGGPRAGLQLGRLPGRGHSHPQARHLLLRGDGALRGRRLEPHDPRLPQRLLHGHAPGHRYRPRARPLPQRQRDPRPDADDTPGHGSGHPALRRLLRGAGQGTGQREERPAPARGHPRRLHAHARAPAGHCPRAQSRTLAQPWR
ncbi:translation initiation factor IF-2 isoform X3 [Nasonia vitripennis]|uniref:Uncharacterized protein n=1 Tax=Nasonia vitripennis TaxID=7425 RepID=A0A7M7QJ18_NASVI|nr:translation initiation factor IF-2 isoform X3 [Nasonia vitripennis]